MAKVTRTEFASTRFRSRRNQERHAQGYNGGIQWPGVPDKKVTSRSRRSQEHTLIRQELEEAPTIRALQHELATKQVVQRVRRNRRGEIISHRLVLA